MGDLQLLTVFRAQEPLRRPAFEVQAIEVAAALLKSFQEFVFGMVAAEQLRGAGVLLRAVLFFDGCSANLDRAILMDRDRIAGLHGLEKVVAEHVNRHDPLFLPNIRHQHAGSGQRVNRFGEQ